MPDAVAIGFQFLFGKGRDSSVEFGDYSGFVVGEGTVFQHRRISLLPDREVRVSITYRNGHPILRTRNLLCRI